MQVLVTCPFGLSSLLSKELKKLQLTPHTTGDTALLLDTDTLGRYTINLWSRIANKVYLVLEQKELFTFDQLFDAVLAVDWEKYLPSNAISVQVTTKHSQLSSQRAIQSIVHKAILTKLSSNHEIQKSAKTLPGTSEKPYEIFLHLEQNQAKICLNTSGASLHQRGWRTQTGPAPLKENLAASMVLLSGWRFTSPLIDTCCGSGTILIEAAMIAKNIAPGARRTFDFQQFNNYDADLRKGLMHQAKEKIFHGQYQLFGTDIDEKVLTYAKANANRAGVADCISFSCGPYKAENSLITGNGEPQWLLTNPPYGNRLSSHEDIAPLYHELASLLHHPHCYGGMISSHPIMKSLFSTTYFSHKHLYNGANKVDFYWKKLDFGRNG